MTSAHLRAIEGFNGLWQSKVWQRHHCANVETLATLSKRYICAYRNKTATCRERVPHRRAFPKAFRFDLNAPLKGAISFLRRSDENGAVHVLGKTYSVDQGWRHRLVRCEVDFTHHSIRVYALCGRDTPSQGKP